jgi:hypothetical protein
MLKSGAHSKKIKICSGPGCKAWDADQVIRQLESSSDRPEYEDVQVCSVPCMKKCGGGVSIRVSSSSGMIKLRSAERVLDELVCGGLVFDAA